MGLRKDKYQTAYTWLMMRLPNDMRPRFRQEYSRAEQHKNELYRRMNLSMRSFSNPTRSSMLLWLFDNMYGNLVHPRAQWMHDVQRLQKVEALKRNRGEINKLKATNRRLVHDLLGERVLDEP